MRITVYGSWRSKNLELRGSAEQFQSACRQIGFEIARRGHMIAVTSGSTSTADYYCVQGALEAAMHRTITSPVIEVTQKQSTDSRYARDIEQNPQLFLTRNVSSEDFEVDQLMSIRDADCVLIIGGGEASVHAGTAALIARKPVVPVGSFGGAGRILLNVIESYASKTPYALLNKQEIGILRGIWTDLQLETVLNAVGINNFPRLMIIHGRSSDWKALKVLLEDSLKLPAPIVMGQEFGGSLTLPEKWEQLALTVHGAIAVATPDDYAAATLTSAGEALSESNWHYQYRARQNVWVEVGWFWGRLSRRRLLLLTRGEVEIPSDLDGIERIPYQESPTELIDKIERFIEFIRMGGEASF